MQVNGSTFGSDQGIRPDTTIEALSQRHEAEHQVLEQRYQKARGTGQTQLPPKGKAGKG